MCANGDVEGLPPAICARRVARRVCLFSLCAQMATSRARRSPFVHMGWPREPACSPYVREWRRRGPAARHLCTNGDRGGSRTRRMCTNGDRGGVSLPPYVCKGWSRACRSRRMRAKGGRGRVAPAVCVQRVVAGGGPPAVCAHMVTRHGRISPIAHIWRRWRPSPPPIVHIWRPRQAHLVATCAHVPKGTRYREKFSDHARISHPASSPSARLRRRVLPAECGKQLRR